MIGGRQRNAPRWSALQEEGRRAAEAQARWPLARGGRAGLPPGAPWRPNGVSGLAFRAGPIGSGRQGAAPGVSALGFAAAAASPGLLVQHGWSPAHGVEDPRSLCSFLEVGSVTAALATETVSAAETGGLCGFTSTAYRLRYSYAEEGTGANRTACVVFRLNLPDFMEFDARGLAGLPDAYADHYPVVILVGGTRSVGVGRLLAYLDTVGNEATKGSHGESGSDDLLATSLNSARNFGDGVALGVPFGRAGVPMVTVTYNNPGYGVYQPTPAEIEAGFVRDPGLGSLESTGNPLYADAAPDNPDGDDGCGPMQRAALEAVVQAVRSLLTAADPAPGKTPRWLLTSFSNGLACASGWMANTSTDIHAYVEIEGPTDGEEVLVCAECYDPLGAYAGGGGCPSLPVGLSALTSEVWADCRSLSKGCGGQDMFEPAWKLYYRSPPSLTGDLIARRDAGTAVYPYASSAYSPAYDPAVLDTDTAYWAERTASTHLQKRKGGYIRINSSSDHVQPTHYNNRHAWRALVAAQVARGCGDGTFADDVFWADDPYAKDASNATEAGVRNAAEPARYVLGMDPDRVATSPTGLDGWPDVPKFTTTAAKGARWPWQLDLLQWAFGATFPSTCSP